GPGDSRRKERAPAIHPWPCRDLGQHQRCPDQRYPRQARRPSPAERPGGTDRHRPARHSEGHQRSLRT
ncbi:hypothetical protein N0V85_010013, partial [Neurospora sp. IMI 360204]